MVAMDNLEFDNLFDDFIYLYDQGANLEEAGDLDIQKEF